MQGTNELSTVTQSPAKLKPRGFVLQRVSRLCSLAGIYPARLMHRYLRTLSPHGIAVGAKYGAQAGYKDLYESLS